MDTRKNISEYFGNIINSLNNIEQAAQVIANLRTIMNEVSQLEKYVKTSFATLDNHFQAYLQQVNLLSNLVEFQRRAIQFKTPEEMTRATFAFIHSHLKYDGAFIHLKGELLEKNDGLLTVDDKSRKVYRSFLSNNRTLGKIRKALRKRELAFLLEKEARLELRELPWEALGAKSTIVFPLRIQRNLFGFGVVFAKREETFSIDQLSFINLILGLLSLMIFQHYYFYQVKERFLEQSRLHQVFEHVKFAEYFDRGPVHIYTLDESGVVLHANTAAIESQEFSHKTPIGEKFIHFLPEDQQEPFEKLLHQVQPGGVSPFLTQLHFQNGANRVWQLFLTRMNIEEKFQLNILLGMDITAQYFRDQIKSRNEVLDQAADFSTTINRYIGDLLSIMVPNVSLMQSQLSKNHEFQTNLSHMAVSLSKTEQLVRTFLNYDLKEIDLPRKTNLNKLILQVISKFREKLGKRIIFKLALSPSVPQLELYVRRIVRLIKIFTQNSLEALHERERGNIRVSTRLLEVDSTQLLQPEMFPLPAGNYVELAFEDDGLGIKPELLPHIFKPLFSTKIKNEGAGMGLFVAYNMVRDLKGEIFVRSTPGESTTFYVYLPVQASRKTAVKGLPVKTAVSNGKPAPSILVVDDEYSIRSVLQEIFESNGFRVLTAENGLEGVEIFEKNVGQIDLVILDMRMPVMGGKEAFLEIKKRKPDQKVIVISGFAKRDELQEILNSGALGFLSKPFQVEDILNQVKSVLVHD